jgi:hemolysin activation/secretion protein
LSDRSKSFGQVVPEFSVYQQLNKKGTIVLAERVGGGITVGKSAFYQSLFIGGHENLLGYRQYRFAGEHMLYNNLELRMKIANFTGYIIPGQFGVVGFFDIGRVWIEDEKSDVWHNGVGGGVYFAPAQRVVINVVAGYSKEGWLPYVTMGFRF